MNASSSTFNPEASLAAARREFGEVREREREREGKEGARAPVSLFDALPPPFLQFGGVNPSIEASTTFTGEAGARVFLQGGRALPLCQC
jgi:hypothetical protein